MSAPTKRYAQQHLVLQIKNTLDQIVTIGYYFFMYSVVYSKQAKRTLLKMPRNVAATIQRKVETLAADPYTQNHNATKLQDRDGYRLRVGDWRIIYEIVDDRLVIHIVRIAARGSIYER